MREFYYGAAGRRLIFFPVGQIFSPISYLLSPISYLLSSDL
jgi:hypothetical protein